MADIKEYVTVREFARRFDMSEMGVRKAIKENRIRKWHKLGNQYVIHKSELQKFGNGGHARM